MRFFFLFFFVTVLGFRFPVIVLVKVTILLFIEMSQLKTSWGIERVL